MIGNKLINIKFINFNNTIHNSIEFPRLIFYFGKINIIAITIYTLSAMGICKADTLTHPEPYFIGKDHFLSKNPDGKWQSATCTDFSKGPNGIWRNTVPIMIVEQSTKITMPENSAAFVGKDFVNHLEAVCGGMIKK
ncbi:MAG: hypothetical protein ABF665_12210 [Gluconacetobacter sp.]